MRALVTLITLITVIAPITRPSGARSKATAGTPKERKMAFFNFTPKYAKKNTPRQKKYAKKKRQKKSLVSATRF